VGNHSAHQMNNWDPNGAANSPDVTIPANNLRPVPNLGSISQTETFGFGNYAGLTAKLEKRYSGGLDFLGSYTWGHALASDATPLSGSSNCCVIDRRDLSASYSTASWDLRHNFVGSFTYDVPFGKGKKYGSNMNTVANMLIGGWQTNGLISLRSGQPFTITSQNGIGQFARVLPDLVPGKNPNSAPAGGRTPDLWFDTSAVTTPAPGTRGNLGLQSNMAPPQKNVDFSLFKDFRVSERMKVQFRGEAINLFNHPYFDVGSINKTQGNPAFGRIDKTISGTERHMQLALRFMF
jgi:hypothetical protein